MSIIYTVVDGFDLSSIHNCTSGGAPLAISIVKAVRARLGFTIKAAYGLSETGGVSFQTGKNWEEDLKLLGSVGKVVPGTEIKIVSTDDERRRMYTSYLCFWKKRVDMTQLTSF